MKERIIAFLQSENKTSSQFAEEIGVQPSSISHIISGRNNPSLDFVLKMLGRYPALSSDWLLFGKGLMYGSQDALSDELPGNSVTETTANKIGDLFDIQARPLQDNQVKADIPVKPAAAEHKPVTAREAVRKIILLYNDNSFEEFDPL